MNEELTMNQFCGAKKAALVLHYIADKMGWKFIPDSSTHFVGVRRLDTPDEQCIAVQEFRIWYQSVSRNFYYNFGSYTNGFRDEPVNINKYKISDIGKNDQI